MIPYSFIVVNIPLQYRRNNRIALFSVSPNPTYDFTAVSYHVHWPHSCISFKITIIRTYAVSLDYTTFESACMCMHCMYTCLKLMYYTLFVFTLLVVSLELNSFCCERARTKNNISLKTFKCWKRLEKK